MGWAWHLLGTVPRAKEFPGQTSIEATPWPNQTLQKAANGAYKGHRFATQSIQTPQIITKTSETKNEGGGEGGTHHKSHSIRCKRTRNSTRSAHPNRRTHSAVSAWSATSTETTRRADCARHT